MKDYKNEIDFIVTWVDGNDPKWLEERKKYKENSGTDTREERFRDFGTIKYFFRSVEKFAPWVRKVYFVTEGHIPEWLNTDCEKLCVVKHEEFMPKEALPTFNSNAIEMNFHKINGLAEKFVYFNDDMLLLNSVSESDFFVEDKTKDMLALQPVVANPNNPTMSSIMLNDSVVISRHFDKRQNIKSQKGKYFHFGYPLMYFVYNALELAFPLYTGFYTVHGPSPLLKSTYEEIWEKEPEVLMQTTMNRFRSTEDVTQYLFREWNKQKGNFVPANLHKMFKYIEVKNDTASYLPIIEKQKCKMVSINDTSKDLDYERVQKETLGALEKVFPDKCMFEK